jgi:phytoene desaturase
MLQTAVWRSLDGELRRFFRSRYIREALGSYGMYLGGSPFELCGLFTILAYGELAYGLWLPKGGIYALVAALERLATELGVTIHKGCRVDRILAGRQGVLGVRAFNGAFFPADVVVSNVDVPTTNRRLLRPPKLKSARSRMTPGVITFYWGLRGGYDGAGHHTIYLPANYKGAFDDLKAGRIPAELPFYVSIPSATDPGLAPPGDTTMFVLVPTPLISQMNGVSWPNAVADVKRRVLERLGLDAARIGFEEVWTPRDWSERFGLYDGSAFGAAHTLFQMGPMRAANYSKEIRGLYYCGAGTTPGTGMPMVVLGGRMVAERIAAHAH